MLALSPRIEEELLRLESLFKPEEPFNPATVVRTLRIAAIDNAFHTLLMPFLETAATAADTRFTKNGLPAARLPKQIPGRGPTSASSCRWRAAATV